MIVPVSVSDVLNLLKAREVSTVSREQCIFAIEDVVPDKVPKPFQIVNLNAALQKIRYYNSQMKKARSAGGRQAKNMTEKIKGVVFKVSIIPEHTMVIVTLDLQCKASRII